MFPKNRRGEVEQFYVDCVPRISSLFNIHRIVYSGGVMKYSIIKLYILRCRIYRVFWVDCLQAGLTIESERMQVEDLSNLAVVSQH